MVGRDGLRDALDDFLHRAQADWDVAHRVTEVLDQSPRGAMHAGEFSDQGTEAGLITGLIVTWHLRFELASTSLALALLQDEVVDLHRDGRQLDDLMGVVGRQGDQVAMATGTGAGLNEMDLGGGKQGGPFATMALLSTPFPCGGFPLPLGLAKRRIRRRRLARGLRRFVDPPLQGLDLFLELLDLCLELGDLLVLGREVILHRRRGDLPLELAKGKRPQDGVDMSLRARRPYHPGSRRCEVCSVSLFGNNVSKL